MYEHQKTFSTILKSKIFVYSKPFIKIISVLLLIFKFVKSSWQSIVQIIRKKKSILVFLINLSSCFIGTYLKPSQYLCGIISLRPSVINYFYKELHLRSCGSLRSVSGTLQRVLKFV